MECNESFENINNQELASFDAIIVPSGIVSDRLRYTEDINKLPPACEFMERAFAHKNILKGIICHGLWIMSPISHSIKGKNMVVHNNLIADAKNYGANYMDLDVVVDDDLITVRSGGHCHFFARKIIEILVEK